MGELEKHHTCNFNFTKILVSQIILVIIMESAWPVGPLAVKPIEGQFSDAEDEPKVNVANLEIKDANAIDTFEKDDDSNAEYDYEASDEFDEDYDYWDENIDGRDRESGVNVVTGGQNRQNGSSSSAKVTKFQPTEKVFTKFVGKINIDKYQGPKVSDQIPANRKSLHEICWQNKH